VALWHAHAALGVETLLVTGRVDPSEAMLSPAAAGVPRLARRDVLAGGRTAGWLELEELGRGVAPWRDFCARRALVALLRAWRPDVVHTHTSKAGWLGRAAAAQCRVPVVAHTFHGHVLQDYFGRLRSRWLVRLETALAARTHLLFAVSDSCADELAALGVAARERFSVVPPAVAGSPLRPRALAREALGIAPDERRAVAVGRLVAIKRLGDFVAAIAGLPGWRGDLVGDGPERAALAAAIERTAPGRVLLRGAEPDIAGLLPAYDALVLPSVREGCPLVAVEAFAAGVPVLGYDVPGVRDVLSRWGRGLLVPAADGPAGLRAALGRLVLEPELGTACATASRDGIGRFAPAAVAAQLADAYRVALGR
jgi:glycosyltransferase involved in cell wall biosynthesis